MNARALRHQTRYHPPSGPSILVVDNDPTVRRITTRILVGAGYAVLDVESGAGALQMLELIGERIQILITDVAMPEMDGLELGVRAQHRWPMLRILYVSATAEGSALGKGEGTARPFLRKPFNAPSLLGFVAQAGGLAPSIVERYTIASEGECLMRLTTLGHRITGLLRRPFATAETVHRTRFGSAAPTLPELQALSDDELIAAAAASRAGRADNDARFGEEFARRQGGALNPHLAGRAFRTAVDRRVVELRDVARDAQGARQAAERLDDDGAPIRRA